MDCGKERSGRSAAYGIRGEKGKQMKKIIVFFLTMLYMAGLNACAFFPGAEGDRPAEMQSVSPAGKDSITENEHLSGIITDGSETVKTKEKNCLTVHIDPIRHEAFDPNTGETLILTFAYDSARVFMDNDPGTAEKINKMLGMMDEAYYSGTLDGESNGFGYQAMLSEAEDQYALRVDPDREGTESALFSQRSISSIKASDAFLEFSWLYYDYLGGAHGSYALRTDIFDTETGEKLRLCDLFREGYDYRGTILARMITLTEEDADNYYSERTSLIEPENREDALYALIRDGSWCFTDDGIRFTSDLYELGPYASGLCEYEIPYEVFGDSIRDKFLLQEPISDDIADVTFVSLSDRMDQGYEIIDRAVIHSDGEDLLLNVRNSVQDLRIYSVSYLDAFQSRTMLWYGNYLKNAAVQLQLHDPQGMPDIMICYRDSEGEHTMLVQHDAGSGFSLINKEQIIAVG